MRLKKQNKDKLNDGAVWFLHDTLEMPEYNSEFYNGSVKNNHWGSSSMNQLILNTHVDSLNTLLYIKLYLKTLSKEDTSFIDKNIKGGIKALNNIYSDKKNKILKYIYQKLDTFFRDRHFKNYDAYKYRFNYRSHNFKIRDQSFLRFFSRLNIDFFYFAY